MLEVLLAFPTPVSSSGSGHAGSHISSSGFSKCPSSDSRSAHGGLAHAGLPCRHWHFSLRPTLLEDSLAILSPSFSTKMQDGDACALRQGAGYHDDEL